MSRSRRDDLTLQLGLLGLCTAVIVASFVLDTTSSTVYLWGWPVPPLCTFRRLTGYPCPGCGLTRSFVFMAHLHWWEALKTNWLGPAAWIFTFAQSPLRSLRAVQAWRGMHATPQGSM